MEIMEILYLDLNYRVGPKWRKHQEKVHFMQNMKSSKEVKGSKMKKSQENGPLK